MIAVTVRLRLRLGSRLSRPCQYKKTAKRILVLARLCRFNGFASQLSYRPPRRRSEYEGIVCNVLCIFHNRYEVYYIAPWQVWRHWDICFLIIMMWSSRQAAGLAIVSLGNISCEESWFVWCHTQTVSLLFAVCHDRRGILLEVRRVLTAAWLLAAPKCR